MNTNGHGALLNGSHQTWLVAGHLSAGAAAMHAGTANGDGGMSENTLQFLAELLRNDTSLGRLDPYRQGVDRRRDVRAECGFPRSMPDALEFLRLYQQDSMAGVVVDRYPDETFKAPGEVWDTEEEGGPDSPFAAAVDALGGRVGPREGESYYKEPEYSPLWRVLCDWDKASRVGRFGLLLVGLADGRPLSQPAAGVEEVGSAPEGYAYDYLPDEYKSYPGDGWTPTDGADLGPGPDAYPPRPKYRGMKVKVRTTRNAETGESEPVLVTNKRVQRVKRNGARYGLTVNRAAQEEAYGRVLTANVYGTPPTADDETEPTGATSDPAAEDPPTEAPKSVERLTYLRAFTEASVTAVRWERNRYSPRYGRPTHYFIDFGDPLNASRHAGPRDAAEVHWTRVLPLASDGRLGAGPLEGVPACWPVWPELYNLQKIGGAGGEGYWSSGVPMTAFKTPPAIAGMPNVRYNESRVRTEYEKMRESLTRMGIFRELQPELLSAPVQDPTPFVSDNLDRIAASLNMPKRKLLGSERGELSSTEDEGDWNDAVRGRRLRRTVPDQLVPLLDRLVLLGVLPEPEGGRYKCGWPADDALGAQEQSAVFASDMTALGTYVEKGIDAVMDPTTMATRYLDMTPAEAQAMLDAATQANADRISTEQDQQMQGQKAQIDAGLAPDPTAAPPPNTEPITVKQGDKVIAHPNATPPGLRPKVLAANPVPKPKPKLNGKRKAVPK